MTSPDSSHHVVLLSLVAFLSSVLLSSQDYTFQCTASSPRELLKRPARICKHYLGRKTHFSRHSRIQRLFDIKQTPEEGKFPGSPSNFFSFLKKFTEPTREQLPYVRGTQSPERRHFFCTPEHASHSEAEKPGLTESAPVYKQRNYMEDCTPIT